MTISGISPVSQYLTAEKDEARAAQTYAKTDPTTGREVADFENKAPTITTADGLIKDYTANQVVLGAYNLKTLANESAIERDLLTQDPSASSSLSKKAGKATWTNLATALSAMGEGKGTAAATPFTSDLISSTVNSFELSQYESSKDLAKSGVGNALYFTRVMNSGKVTTLNQLMSDPTLLKVAIVVSGYNPDQFGALDFRQQQSILEKKVDMKAISTPKGVEKYAEQYLTGIQMNPDYIDNDQPNTLLDLFGSDEDDGILALFGGS
ncbi:hypothetical protein AA14337_3330 [Acetobacter malorum DSM 14337]|uniref:DUF1217 domain-containing protein n=1 Tax=Acetobacter malorum DSM 14337 TaxID=1307910 RepID=A0ABQ0Q0Z5_9PROT|nr:DUF1217 domain-containing protein [Acetobacter malorum]KXV06480.1 hypothetical protein AD930_07700 [Acetobacter malorum]GBQ86472.1 hypothetical protein AA14337_3330 [Acetobacter malorum DSM 14337]